MPRWVAWVVGTGDLGFWAQAYMEDPKEAIWGSLSTPPLLPVPRSRAGSIPHRIRDLVIMNTESHNHRQGENSKSSSSLWAPGLRPENRGRWQRPGNGQSHRDQELAMTSFNPCHQFQIGGLTPFH